MNYAKAVKIVESLDLFYAENNSTGRHSEAPEALAALRRAEKVLGMVEQVASIGQNLGYAWWSDVDQDRVLRAAFTYKKQMEIEAAERRAKEGKESK